MAGLSDVILIVCGFGSVCKQHSFTKRLRSVKLHMCGVFVEPKISITFLGYVYYKTLK